MDDMLHLVPASHADLLSDACRAFAYLATLMKDGSPQVTPVWFDVEGETVRVNTARGRVKDRNMQKRPRVALVIQDPDDMYRYIQVRGTVVAISEEGALEHIDRLAGKYTGDAHYRNLRPGDVRVIYRIRPDAVDAHG
jgi:PPOX class probable F420-dependent enzyme